MSGTLHKDLTGLDLHVAKLHADTHLPAGTDPLVLAESQVTDLTADLAGKVDEGDARLTDARTPSAHTHPESEVTNLVTDLAGKVGTGDSRLSDSRAPTVHTQAESTVIDLVDDLAGKAPTVHSHIKADITDFPVIGAGAVTAVTGTSPVVSSEGATPAISLPAATNAAPGYATAAQIAALEAATAAQHAIATIGTGNGLSIEGQAISLAPATASVPGAATAAQITKLDGIAAGANVGDVVGPAAATDGHLAVFDTTTGKLLKDGGAVPAGGGGSGDMLKSTYDTDNDGKVNTAAAADAVPWSGVSSKPTLGTAAAKNIPAAGNAAATEVVYGSDTRLADARIPSAHTHALAAGATDVTATAAELNALDGITANVMELNYTDGVTSGIQAQINAKAAAAGLTNVDNTSDATKNAAAVTVTNHRFTRRVDTQTTTDTITPEISTYDIFIRTAQAHALVINNHSSSTPVDGDMMLFEILSDATARAITYGNKYVAKAGVALPSTTVASKNLTMLFIWRNDLTQWVLLSAGQEA